MGKIKRISLYLFVFLSWFLVACITISLVHKVELQKVQGAFNQRVLQIYDTIDHVARDNEAILEGFSAFLSAIEYADRESASRYARQVVARYPHVYRLGVVLSVNRKDRASFVARQRKMWFPKFKIKPVNFGPGHAQFTVPKKAVYHPIVFVEPNMPRDRHLIGIDVASAPFLRDAIDEAKNKRSTVATTPFDLAGGPRGYVLFRPVLNRSKAARSKQKEAFVLLEVDAEAVGEEISALTEDYGFSLYDSRSTAGESDGSLVHIPMPQPSRLEARLLPKVTAEKLLDRPAQPYALRVEKHLTWNDINLPLVIATLSIALLSLFFLMFLLSSYFRRERQRQESAERLLHMATHDPLTGLPNRILLADRFKHACTRTVRRNSQFSAMFIDLNAFKKVNDTYGHEIGDQLLNTVGDLLKNCIRDEDTLSRISGDEFVILLEDTSYRNAEKIAEKIQVRFATPIVIDGIELGVRLSLGIAVYPDDGMTMSELLRKADERMYAVKVRSKTEVKERA